MNGDVLVDAARSPSQHYSEPSDVDIFLMYAARPEWTAQAACRGKGPRDWYPSQGDSHTAAAVNARAICKTCPVIEECREYAIGAHPLEYGIWGNTSEKQRKLIRLKDPDRYRLDRRVHGTVSRYNDGCKCGPCKRANADYRRSSKERSRRNRLARGAA